MGNFQVEIAFQHGSDDSVQASCVVRRTHRKWPSINERDRCRRSATYSGRVSAATDGIKDAVAQLWRDGSAAVNHSGNGRNRHAGFLRDPANRGHMPKTRAKTIKKLFQSLQYPELRTLSN